MHYQTRALLRDHLRRAEQRARVIEVGLIAVVFVVVGLLRQRR